MKNIKFSSQADQWFPTTIWTSVLDLNSKLKINEEIVKGLSPYIENSELKNLNYLQIYPNLKKRAVMNTYEVLIWRIKLIVGKARLKFLTK